MKLFSQISFLIFFGLILPKSFSQLNLVPNYSFEVYDTCPVYGDQVHYSIGWSKYCQDIFTPDYYNACAPDSGLDIPNNIYSYQPDHRNCSAYMGLITWTSSWPQEREIIGAQLSEPMVIGQKYFISLYAVAGTEKFIDGWHYSLFSNNIGVRLATIPYNENNPCPIDNYAHLNYTSILTDTTNWTRISGSIVADSAYEYIILGNFFDDANTDTLSYLQCANCLSLWSYYLIDDVCVSTDSLLCNGGIDVIPCITGVEESSSNAINIYPNPVQDDVNIQFDNPFNGRIRIIDSFGREIYYSNPIGENQLKIDLSSVPSGIYFLAVNFYDSRRSVFKKILKQ